MIEVTAATKAFGSRTLWSGLDLTVDRGTMTALVGPSGSGKSTLLNCIGLLDDLDSGSVRVDGQVVDSRSPRRRRRFRARHLGYLFQNYALVDKASVRANLDVAAPVTAPGRARRLLRRRQDEALATVGLSGRGRDRVYTMSGGEQQRVALARLIVKRPSIVLADEPTGALDDDNAAMVLDTLRQLADQGAAVLVATHSHDVMQRCDAVFDVADPSRNKLRLQGVGQGTTDHSRRNP